MDCLEKLQDAGKLLAELMNSQTKSRRALILAGVDKQTRAMLDETKPDKLLFGEKLGEKVRETKSLESVANALRKQPNQNSRPPFTARQPLNSFGLQGRKPSQYNTGRQQGFNSVRGRGRIGFRGNYRNQPFNQRAPYQGQYRFKNQDQRR